MPLPAHFVVRLVPDRTRLVGPPPPVDAQLYVDVFDSGRLLSLGDAAALLAARGVDIGPGQLPEFATAASHRQIFLRTIANVANACARAGDEAGGALWLAEARVLQGLCDEADTVRRISGRRGRD